MRQITKKIAEYFNAGLPLTIDNTRTDGEKVWLFGNMIAEADHRLGLLKITLCGHDTATTKERLNGIMQKFGVDGRIYSKNRHYILEINGKRVPDFNPFSLVTIKYK